MFKNIYQGKRVLVTGHTGFKGSWLCIWLKELGAEVVGYSFDPPSEPNNFSACRLSEHIDHQYGDVRDQDGLISISAIINFRSVTGNQDSNAKSCRRFNHCLMCREFFSDDAHPDLKGTLA